MSNRIAILSKYPPLEGGIAAKTYWLARGLANRGHEIHIIADGLDVGGKYRIKYDGEPAKMLPNLYVHRPTGEMPWHIPENDEQSLALLALTLGVIREHDIEVLDTGYLIPYGIIGGLAKRVTGVRHVLRHGGSDIEKFLKGDALNPLLRDSITHADMVITEERHVDLFKQLNSNIIIQSPYIVDTEAFTLADIRRKKKRIAVIGKVNYHWRYKGLHQIAEIMRSIAGEFECILVCQGNGLADFKKSLGGDYKKYKWQRFVPPWEMPRLLNQLDALFIFDSSLPHPVVSNLAMEALCSGVGIITDRADFKRTYEDVISIKDDQILVIQPPESALAASAIANWLDSKGNRRERASQLVSFSEYIAANEKVYESIIGAN
jgi:glycosyltransferase involved in cell wall biosynthesis